MIRLLVNVCRILLGLTLTLSGLAKAIDPRGTQYKIEDYLGAIGLSAIVKDWQALTLSVTLSTVEFLLGILLLFAIRRRLVSMATLLLMTVMTAISIWIVIANPVSDCGCFGDAIHLTNGQTLLKNIVLLGCAIMVAWKLELMPALLPKSIQWIVPNGALLSCLAISAWGLYYLPLIDFRPYHIGADIRAGMTIPEGEKGPTLQTTFIMEKDGERKEFTLENYPDSTWTFIDSKTVEIEKGYEPPIHDFSIVDNESGEDITKQVVNDKGYTFLLISPYLEQADSRHFGEIDAIYEYAKEHRYAFYCLTSSNDKAIADWKDITGAEYPFCMTDATTLKTIIRSNPGLVLIRNGKVMGKWSHHNLPKTNSLDKQKTM